MVRYDIKLIDLHDPAYTMTVREEGNTIDVTLDEAPAIFSMGASDARELASALNILASRLESRLSP